MKHSFAKYSLHLYDTIAKYTCQEVLQRKLVIFVGHAALPTPTGLDDGNVKAEGPAAAYRCHCEERSDVAISWTMVPVGMVYQEIATPLRARNDVVI